jgi:hypothetical protein
LAEGGPARSQDLGLMVRCRVEACEMVTESPETETRDQPCLASRALSLSGAR